MSSSTLSAHGTTFKYGAHTRANGIRQHYLRYGGAGPALVLVPGIVSPAALWDHVGQRLGRVFDTYVLDVRGRGLSESGPHLDYGVNACAADVAAFAASLNLRQYTLLGHSMGARIALRASRTAGAALARLVLVDPPVSGPGRRPYPVPIQRTLDMVQAGQRGEAEQALRQPGVAPWPEELLMRRAEWLHTCDERAVHVAYKDFHEDDMHIDLPHVAVPAILVSAGGKGGAMFEEDVAEIERLLPGIATRRLANAGHQLQVDDFDGFFAALGETMGIEL